jgi:hypothetical protein
MPADAHAAVKISVPVICIEQHQGQKVSPQGRAGRDGRLIQIRGGWENMAHPVPDAEYGDSSGGSVGTADEERVEVEDGQSEAP